MFNKYIKDDSGQFAIITAVSMMVLLLVIALAMDSGKGFSQRSKLADATDTALVAYAKEFMESGDESKGRQSAQRYIQENFEGDHPTTLNLDGVRRDGDEYIFTGNSVTQGNTLLMSLFGRKKLQISADAEVRLKLISISAAVVPDVSYSMRGGDIAAVRRAMQSFADSIYDIPAEYERRLQTHIAPYAGSVNISATQNGRNLLGSWEYSADLEREADHKKFYRDPNRCNANFERHEATPIHNGSRINIRRNVWKNVVVGHRRETHHRNEERVENGQRRNVRVPYNVDIPEYGMRCAFEDDVEIPWNGCVQTRSSEFNPDNVLGNGSRPPLPSSIQAPYNIAHCPPGGSALRANIQSRNDFRRFAGQLDIGFSTNHDIGLLWGARTLEPAWASFFGQESRPWSDERFPKFLVFMSDGKSAPVRYEFGDYTNRTRDRVDRNTLRICNYLKSRDVTIFGISYSSHDRQVDVVKECASDNLHYHANNTSVEDVFEQIAETIKDAGIRISE